MKKGLFNKIFGLQTAVIEGRKTMTRRMCKNQINPSIEEAKWKIGEVIAVAQSYEDMANEGGDILANMLQDETTFKKEYCGAGWNNAMFVKADLMPHRIKITNVRIERLQDISPEDCKAEGVWFNANDKAWYYGEEGTPYRLISSDPYDWKYMAKLTFARLIDRVSGRGTWERNPWVFVYDFELVR